MKINRKNTFILLLISVCVIVALILCFSIFSTNRLTLADVPFDVRYLTADEFETILVDDFKAKKAESLDDELISNQYTYKEEIVAGANATVINYYKIGLGGQGCRYYRFEDNSSAGSYFDILVSRYKDASLENAYSRDEEQGYCIINTELSGIRIYEGIFLKYDMVIYVDCTPGVFSRMANHYVLDHICESVGVCSPWDIPSSQPIERTVTTVPSGDTIVHRENNTENSIISALLNSDDYLNAGKEEKIDMLTDLLYELAENNNAYYSYPIIDKDSISVSGSSVHCRFIWPNEHDVLWMIE